ncbi:MAG: transglutaminase domain-containing protein [Agathobacter sp.]
MKRIFILVLTFLMLLGSLSGCQAPQPTLSNVELFSEGAIRTITFESDLNGYSYSFHGSSVQKIIDYFLNLGLELNTTPDQSDVTGTGWTIMAEYEDDHDEVIYIQPDGIHIVKKNEKYKVTDGSVMDIHKLVDSLKDVLPPTSPQIQQPDWSGEIIMSAGDILAKIILDDVEKELIKEIFEKDVEWVPEIPECDWSCRFISSSVDVAYCDCGTLSDLKNNRSRKLTEEEKESLIALISDYSKNEEPIFVYDKYMITADGRNYLSEREYELYKKMIDSIIAHSGVVEGFESFDEFFKVWGFMLSEFVPARNMVKTYLNAEEPFAYNDGTATLAFVGDKETCERNYAAFEDIMNEALAMIRAKDTDWERLAKLYLYVSNNMSYGSPNEAYEVYGDFYDCIVYKKGTCVEYAYYLNMLANQIGFETIDGRSLGKDGFVGADHAWSMIYVDGQWYHFDACWQATSFPQERMQYFAFSTDERYTSLSNNSFWGEPGDLEMFNQDDYTKERGELPYCESGMSEEERIQLYHAVGN